MSPTLKLCTLLYSYVKRCLLDRIPFVGPTRLVRSVNELCGHFALKTDSSHSGRRHRQPFPRSVRYHYKPGARLLREWQGKTHEVIVVEDGDFLYAGARYRSLSKIARVITGTQWSGPSFFGLNQARETAAKSDGDLDG